MDYYIYESHPHNKAILHKGSCVYCRNGTDSQGTKSRRDGAWLGPYSTHQKAFIAVKETRRRIQSSCRHCLPPSTANDAGVRIRDAA